MCIRATGSPQGACDLLISNKYQSHSALTGRIPEDHSIGHNWSVVTGSFMESMSPQFWKRALFFFMLNGSSTTITEVHPVNFRHSTQPPVPAMEHPW